MRPMQSREQQWGDRSLIESSRYQTFCLPHLCLLLRLE